MRHVNVEKRVKTRSSMGQGLEEYKSGNVGQYALKLVGDSFVALPFSEVLRFSIHIVLVEGRKREEDTLYSTVCVMSTDI